MDPQAQEFAEVAEQFCMWAESAPESSDVEVTVALNYLIPLYQRALALPELFGDEESEAAPEQEWGRVYQRFGALPFNYYSQCFDPHKVAEEEAVVADVADDLADIWRDLKRGLDLFQNGHVSAAVWDWRQSFLHHWGHHAVGAIYALHCWLTEHPE